MLVEYAPAFMTCSTRFETDYFQPPFSTDFCANIGVGNNSYSLQKRLQYASRFTQTLERGTVCHVKTRDHKVVASLLGVGVSVFTLPQTVAVLEAGDTARLTGPKSG